MAIRLPRVRIVNVRVSEEEYLAMERFCASSGARSLSELVRNTMHQLVSSSDQESKLATTVNENAQQVKRLEEKINCLSAEVAQLRNRKSKQAKKPITK